MFGLALACALIASPSATVTRDAYGVPTIRAATFEEAFHHFGRAVAEDRLWQMEMSRRLATGRMAEVLGRSALASDRSILRKMYTQEELTGQFKAMPPRVQAAFRAYAAGVNEVIQERTKSGTLPAGYAEHGFQPEPWKVEDSCAITIQMAWQFGGGGAGELRNTALHLYLQGQKVKDRVLDVMDDLAWHNDPESIPTVPLAEDPLAQSHPRFYEHTRADTERSISLLPRTNLLELAPAIQASIGAEEELLALQHGLPYTMGSYAVAVGKSRSATGMPLLLTAPQMGHTTPSIVHEVVLDAPGLQVAGMDVPGIPAVVIGHTPNLAWGLTSGVADIDDVTFSPKVDAGTYRYGQETRKIERIARQIRVKGEEPVEHVQLRTHDGPVLLDSRVGNALYSLRSSYRGREMGAISAVYDLYTAQQPEQVAAMAARVPVSFNLFYATTRGDIGYHYCGLVPIRVAGLDPRFPAPARPEYEWQGFVSASQMPHLVNPASGLIANWNNKPASWWPNGDTPVWGSIFRNEILLKSLGSPQLSRWDLERAAWDIARKDTASNGAFKPLFDAWLQNVPSKCYAQTALVGFDGWAVDGSVGALLYRETVRSLRRQLFLPWIGNLTGEALFEQAVQPDVIRRALRGETRFDFLAGRTVQEVLDASFAETLSRLEQRYGADPAKWTYSPGAIPVPGQPPIPYINRGTYIQITELTPTPFARSVASPGVAESGPHALDQVPLARAWSYKTMQAWEPKPAGR